jgi:hypothetical protein
LLRVLLVMRSNSLHIDDVNRKLELISFIAGTNLLLVYLFHTEELICVNVTIGEVVTRYPMGPIIGTSMPYEEDEQWSLALLVKRRQVELSEPRYVLLFL